MTDDDDDSEELTIEEELAILALLKSDAITIDIEEDTPVAPAFSMPTRNGPLDRTTPFHTPSEEILKQASGELAADLEADRWADLLEVIKSPVPEAPPPPPPISSHPPQPDRQPTGRYLFFPEPSRKRKKKRDKR